MISLLNSISALTNQRTLATSSRAIQTSLERLATGKQINRASDDPSGMTAAVNLTGQERSLHKQLETLAEEDSFLAAREGAQSVLSDMLVELSGLVVSAADKAGRSREERESMQVQADSILQAIDMLSNTAEFKGEQILTGFHSGRMGEQAQTRIGRDGQVAEATVSLASLAHGGQLNLVSGDLETAQNVIDAATQSVSGSRSAIGSRMIAIGKEMDILQTQLENASAARSAIEDTDYAKEVGELVRNQVLQSAQVFMAQMIQEQIRSVTVDLLKPIETKRIAA